MAKLSVYLRRDSQEFRGHFVFLTAVQLACSLCRITYNQDSCDGNQYYPPNDTVIPSVHRILHHFPLVR